MSVDYSAGDTVAIVKTTTLRSNVTAIAQTDGSFKELTTDFIVGSDQSQYSVTSVVARADHPHNDPIGTIRGIKGDASWYVKRADNPSAPWVGIDNNSRCLTTTNMIVARLPVIGAIPGSPADTAQQSASSAPRYWREDDDTEACYKAVGNSITYLSGAWQSHDFDQVSELESAADLIECDPEGYVYYRDRAHDVWRVRGDTYEWTSHGRTWCESFRDTFEHWCRQSEVVSPADIRELLNALDETPRYWRCENDTEVTYKSVGDTITYLPSDLVSVSYSNVAALESDVSLLECDAAGYVYYKDIDNDVWRVNLAGDGELFQGRSWRRQSQAMFNRYYANSVLITPTLARSIIDNA